MIAELLKQVGPGVQHWCPRIGGGPRIGAIGVAPCRHIAGQLAVVGKLAIPGGLDFADRLVVGPGPFGLVAEAAGA
jgi:hypothetical protein